MSTERGNNHRSRPPKYQNTVAYKNNMHDTSKRTKEVNNLIMESLCARCKGILEWKVKYKKYRPLSQPTMWSSKTQEQINREFEKGLEGLRERERRTLLRIAENSSKAEHTAQNLS
ncbi:hypothetical protein CSKR_108463 [Clonorchis sinensis]|uniref:Uncharacterized protein n=1 Tax=Clonorchis sinensis TaxID=79923 RepID=A0A8T1MV44_CLOSI|nr:hypothetical protein CSKR_108463 [Clonorchis sinensis]